MTVSRRCGLGALAFLLLLAVALLGTRSNDAAPPAFAGADSRVYKTVGGTTLRLHIYRPTTRSDAPLPAMVFFFGGGWRNGSPAQFVEQAGYLATRGMVAITVDYRVSSRHDVTPLDCIADAKSALRWVRRNATDLGIDANRIAAGGGSAGGYLAAALATLDGFDDQQDDVTTSPVPNALVLFNPALDVTALPQDYGFGEQAAAASPQHHVRAALPATIIFHGTADHTVPFEQATRFCASMTSHGNACEVKAYEGRDHGFFNFGGDDYTTTVRGMDEFLSSLEYLSGTPTL